MNSFQNLFIFSKKQKKGAAILIALLLLIHFFQKAYFSNKSASPLILHIPELSPKSSLTPASIGINTADTLELKKLPGIGSILSTRIVRFRKAKKGFLALEELQKVYGLTPETYKTILPYLYLDSYPQSPSPSPKGQKAYSNHKRIYDRDRPDSLNINTANIQEFQRLPGIGEVLGNRIIRYREAIGGYTDLTDLQKVYNLPDSTYQKILPYLYMESHPEKSPAPTASIPKKTLKTPKERSLSVEPISPININTADSTQLKQLPGIGSVLAKRIISYRKIIGFYSKEDFLTKVYGLSIEQIEPLKPYIRIGDLSEFKKEDLNMLPEWKIKKYPFWADSELKAFLLWKKKIRRVDSWQEVETSKTVSPHTLEQLQTYFHL